MSSESWKKLFEIVGLILLAATFVDGWLVWYFSGKVNDEAEIRLRDFDAKLTESKTELAKAEKENAEAQLRLRTYVDEANAVAKDAQSGLANFRAPRLLTPDQQKRIGALLVKEWDKKQQVMVVAFPITVETGTLAQQILAVAQIGFPWATWFRGFEIAPMTGHSAVSDVVIFSTRDDRSVRAAETLAKGLTAEGIKAGAVNSLLGCEKIPNTNPDDPYCFQIFVVVGPKQ